MMRSMKTLASIVLVSLVLGCSVPSLHSIVTPQSRQDDAELVGLWSAGEDGLLIRIDRPEPAVFEVTVIALPDDARKIAKPVGLDVSLVKIGDALYADLVLNTQERQAAGDRHVSMVVRAHQFVKFRREGDTLRLWAIDYEEMRDRLHNATLTLAHARLDASEGGPDIVLTASTEELQAFLRAHEGDQALWTGEIVLTRTK